MDRIGRMQAAARAVERCFACEIARLSQQLRVDRNQFNAMRVGEQRIDRRQSVAANGGFDLFAGGVGDLDDRNFRGENRMRPGLREPEQVVNRRRVFDVIVQAEKKQVASQYWRIAQPARRCSEAVQAAA